VRGKNIETDMHLENDCLETSYAFRRTVNRNRPAIYCSPRLASKPVADPEVKARGGGQAPKALRGEDGVCDGCPPPHWEEVWEGGCAPTQKIGDSPAPLPNFFRTFEWKMVRFGAFWVLFLHSAVI